MAENSEIIDATPEDVFDVLLDAHSYEDWVVGCQDIRAVDRSWPEPGSRFHHRVGVGPVNTEDTTAIVSVDKPRELVLEARARPAGVARVRFTVDPTEDGTKVTMVEHPVDGPAETLDNPVFDEAIEGRNIETLRRLKELVEKRRSRG